MHEAITSDTNKVIQKIMEQRERKHNQAARINKKSPYQSKPST